MIRTFHYVSHWNALVWLKLGWVIVKPNCLHQQFDQYAVIMEWLCDCNMVKPK